MDDIESREIKRADRCTFFPFFFFFLIHTYLSCIEKVIADLQYDITVSLGFRLSLLYST